MNEVLFGLDFLTYYFYLAYFKFIGYPLILRICILVVILCIVAYILLTIYLLYGILRRRNEKRRYQRLHQRYYQHMLAISADPVTWKDNEIGDRLSLDRAKRLKHEEMRGVTQLFVEAKLELEDRVNELNFQGIQSAFRIARFFEREIQFGRTTNKVQALKAIQSINCYVSEAVLVRFLYHRKLELRNAARFAYMWLSQSDPFRFFDEDTTMRLRKWDMAELHTIMQYRQHTEYPMPSFMKWVNGQVEDDVKIFFVNEIKYFKQTDSCPPLAEQLNTRNIALRSEIIHTLAAMKYRPAEKKMVDSYDIQPEQIKWDIIEAVSTLKTGNGVSFLWQAYEEADDTVTRLMTIKALYEYNDVSREAFDALEAQATGFNKQMFAHVRNPLINRG